MSTEETSKLAIFEVEVSEKIGQLKMIVPKVEGLRHFF